MSKKREMIVYNGREGSLGKDGDSITILTYNLLAPHLSQDPELIEWEKRKVKLLEELVHYNADVMCLQEIHDLQVNNYFGPELRNHGYDFIINTEHIPNPPYYGPKMGRFKMGCAIFYKRLGFRLRSEYKIDFHAAIEQFLEDHELDQHECANVYRKIKAGVGCVLEFIPKKRRLMVCIVTVHLTADPKMPDVKALQTYLLLKGLSVIEKTNIPIIIAGDFNMIPKSEQYMMITRRQTPNETANCEHGIDLRPFLRSPMAASLESAYSTILKPGSRKGLKECKRMNRVTMEPKFTTISNIHTFKDTIDYIFYSGEDFTVEGILELIDDVEALPNEVWPSDHIALMADMRLKKNRKVNYKLATQLANPWAIRQGTGTSTSKEDVSDN